ncbi:MAG: plastocyanin/azurin family copper-binding protein [Gaiellaceae bacterium]
MIRGILAAVAVAALSLAVASTAFGRPSTSRTLNGSVGPGFTITLKQRGKLVKTLKPGTYKFVIADKAPIHNFELDGPHGLAKTFSSVPFTGMKTVTLKLKAGKYKYYCKPHEATMFGRFTVK